MAGLDTVTCFADFDALDAFGTVASDLVGSLTTLAPATLARAANLFVMASLDDSMAGLQSRGMIDPLREWILADRPFFGICIGYQALFERSQENPGVAGLGIFEGEVVRFPHRPGLKVPHMGWNQVRLNDPANIAWSGQDADPYFYFVHSYYPSPCDPTLTAGTTDYEGEFVCAIQRGNLIATQFHPEKSQTAGLQLLGQFVREHGEA